MADSLDKRTRRAATAPAWSRWQAYRTGSFVRHRGELYLAARDMPAHWEPKPGGSRFFWRHIPREKARGRGYVTRELTSDPTRDG